MSVKHLKTPTGEVAPAGSLATDTADRIVRKAILVHAGPDGSAVTFGSADGAISFDDARIQAVVDSQNDLIDKMAEHYGGFEKIPCGAFPPILDQHEADSTNRVIGRLTGRLEFARRSVPKVGDDVACAVADITFLGSETVERVRDGRIFHLSIGIDEATNTLTETSAVIDPAAPGAMILKNGLAKDRKRMAKIAKVMDGEKLIVTVSYGKDEHASESDAGYHADKVARQSGYSIDESTQYHDVSSSGVHIIKNVYSTKVPVKGLKGAKVPIKKLQAARLKKLAAAQKTLSAVSTKLVAAQNKISLAAAQSNVTKRLSSVVRGGKMTPAEFKKIDIKKLAALDKNALSAVVEAYEAREPQVLVGQRGSAAAMDFTSIGRNLEKPQQKRLRAEIKGDLRRMGAKLKSDDEDEEEKPSKKLADAPADKKHLEESDSAVETVPNVDEVQGIEGIQQQIDELNTQISRVVGIVSDLVKESQSEGEEGDEDMSLADADEESESELEADPEKKDKAELEDGSKNDDDKKDLEAKSDEEDKNK